MLDPILPTGVKACSSSSSSSNDDTAPRRNQFVLVHQQGSNFASDALVEHMATIVRRVRGCDT